MKKTDVLREKKIVDEMQANYRSLSASDKQELLRLKCRTDFLTFAAYITEGNFRPYKVHKLISSFIQQVGDGQSSHKKTAISLPPRTGKSMLISQIFPAWQIGRVPHAQHIMSSYAQQLSTENSRYVIGYLTSSRFKKVFPECVVKEEKCNLLTIRTESGGILKVSSAGGAVTGFGYGTLDMEDLPGIGILDDLLADGNSAAVMENTFAWCQAQFLTRGLPNHAIISMGTRFHKDDVIGRLLQNDPDGWNELNVPALCTDEETDPLNRKLNDSHWPEFFPTDMLIDIRKNIGAKDFDALYQGRPTGEEGAIFKHHWFEFFPTIKQFPYVFMTVDTACKKTELNDYTGICVWGYDRGDNSLNLIHAKKERLEFPELQNLIPELAQRWRVRCIYIEGRGNGIPLIQTLKKNLRMNVKELKPAKDKVSRAHSVAPMAEMGQIKIYENIPFIDDLMNELCAFPYVKHDDFTDAFVYGGMVFRDEIRGMTAQIGGDRDKMPSIITHPEKQTRRSSYGGPTIGSRSFTSGRFTRTFN